MSLRFASRQLADLRHHAQLLVERAGDQEGQLDGLEALIAAYVGVRHLVPSLGRPRLHGVVDA
jgi:hypothetical protein